MDKKIAIGYQRNIKAKELMANGKEMIHNSNHVK
jgi:hypothetical protein